MKREAQEDLSNNQTKKSKNNNITNNNNNNNTNNSTDNINNNNNIIKNKRKKKKTKKMSLKDKFIASMVLAGVGDALGYKNGSWEFEFSGLKIHKAFDTLGGLEKISLGGWSVSDDQVMHLATAKALIANPNKLADLYKELSKEYIECFKDMAGRAPGPTTSMAIHQMEAGTPYYQIPYSRGGGGCGGSMRAMCIGLRFYGPENRDKLIAVGIESGRMTHNHPTGFLGSLVSALFTAFAIEGVAPVEWGRKFLNEILPQAYKYLEESGRNWDDYQKDLKYFENAWTEYLQLRKILDPEAKEAVFPSEYGVKVRDDYYSSISFSGWGGASGHDSVIIAYDALLGAGSDFNELVLRGVLHGGDNDSTGVISCAWWGAIHATKNVPKNIYEKVEYRARAEKYGAALYKIRHAN